MKYKKCCLKKDEASVKPSGNPAPFPLEYSAPVPLQESDRVPYAVDEYICKNPDSAVTKMERLARQADQEEAAGRPEKAYELFRKAQALARDDDGLTRNVLQDIEQLCMNNEALAERGAGVSAELEALNLKMGARLQAALAAA